MGAVGCGRPPYDIVSVSNPPGVGSDDAHRRGPAIGAAPGRAGVLTKLRTALENADFTVERIETALGVAELSAAPE